jgi:hypothetical protein
MSVEPELEVRAERQPGPIGHEITQGCAFGAAGATKLRNVDCHRIVERQVARFGQAGDHRGNHRLVSDPAANHVSAVTGSPVLTSAVPW